MRDGEKNLTERKREAEGGSLKLGYIKITIHLFKAPASSKQWLFGLIFSKKFRFLST